MAPVSDWLKTAGNRDLNTSFQDCVSIPLPINNGQTDLYYFVFGTVSLGRPSGSTQIQVTTRILATLTVGGGPNPAVSVGAGQGQTITLAGAVGVVDSQSSMQVVKVLPGGSITVKLQAKASATGVAAMSSATQSGEKVTTLVAFRTP